MHWKLFGAIIAAVAVLLWIQISTSENVSAKRAEWRELYRPTAVSYPEDNPYSPAKVELGRKLFFDPILSGSQVRSCSTCHDPSLSWGDGLPKARGEAPLPWRSPTLIAIAAVPRLGWDGKFRDLESVTFGPITSPRSSSSNQCTAAASSS